MVRLIYTAIHLSRIVAMNIAPPTTRGHSPITMDFHTTQLQITHRLHFPSSTAPTQLFTIITLAPVFHLTITITQSHTLYLNSGLSPTHCRVLLACLHTKRFPSLPCLIPVFRFLPVFLVYSLCLALWI